MQEDYFYLNLNGERVFAGHYRPDMPASRAVVLCHPLGEEKLWAHRVFVTFAREMAAAGTAVLRFDYRGEGDSDRPFEQTDLETRVEDASLAVDTVRELNQSVTDVTLLGLRFGAIVAAMTAARRSDVSRLVLWDAILDGGAYMQSVLRLNLMYQMAQHRKVIETRDALVTRMAGGETVNIEGYEMSEQLFRQTCNFQLAEMLSPFRGQALLVQIGQDESPLRPEFAELARTMHGCRAEVVTEEPFWREIKTFYQRAAELTKATGQFLDHPA
jgi:exosortase A-associated hydrolase 2